MYVPKALAESQTAGTQNTSLSYRNEKEKALKAGYSEKEFEAIMNIPKQPAETDVSKFGGANGRLGITSDEQKLVNEAEKYLGVPYQWGGNTPAGFDCSGLVQYVYAHALGINLPRSTSDQQNCGTAVSLNNLQIGDLLFWHDSARGTYHVALYIGNNQYIHSPQPGESVKISTISSYFMPSFARRILSTDPKKIPNTDGQKAGENYIFRLYNMNAGQHFYTPSVYEAKSVQNAGWNYEGVGWAAPTSGGNVYRLLNPNSGEHFYTASNFEKDSLVKAGWKFENISWHSGGKMPVYRLFNPNAKGNQDSHFYTLNSYERDNLIKNGWKSDGTVWYALRLVNQ